MQTTNTNTLDHDLANLIVAAAAVINLRRSGNYDESIYNGLTAAVRESHDITRNLPYEVWKKHDANRLAIIYAASSTPIA